RRTGICFAAAALLICFSRVFVGTHYASDVLGGAITGVLAALVLPSLYWEGTALDRRITRIL
ncbi:MAG: phosphatase PAP2 family protein, partial [Paracoccaceae bacterium]|nr:phosphatase PAP2 family protein [Paracoccaceae bacterium]